MLGVRSRSFHAPHGITINGPASENTSTNNSSAAVKLKRKFSWSSPRLRKASSEGLLTHRPVVLKEGYLSKPGFFRFGGKKRRWCVLRTYTQSEASLDIYMDETKGRYKGSISLDRESNPILMVKSADGKKKSAKQCYLSLKVGKNRHQFTTDSFRELKEWCALLRQAMDNGNTFSGRVTEPVSLDDGMVNLKINSNCIALECPINEQSSVKKSWRLDRITSFGQSSGNLTFESCRICGDPSATRCCISLVQEKPTTILNILERAIRSNPNTNEIHYERSILGDIYHCNHECGQAGRLIPAYSDPHLYRSASASPLKGLGVGLPVAMDFNDSDGMPTSTMHSNDSGLPGTPPADENGSLTSSLPSPSGSSSESSSHGHDNRVSSSPFRSPKHSISSHQYPYFHQPPPGLSQRSMSDSRTNGQAGANWRISRRQSDEVPHRVSAVSEQRRRMSDDQVTPHAQDEHIYDQPHEQHPVQESPRHKPRLTYAMISHELPPKLIRSQNGPPSPVTYATVHTKFDAPPQLPRDKYDRLQRVDEMYESDHAIYDEPNCEPVNGSPFSPPMTPAHRSRKKSTSSASSGTQSQSDRESSVFRSPARTSATSASVITNGYHHGRDAADRAEDFEDLPPAVPTRHRRQRPVKELVTLKTVPVDSQPYRRRLQSSSEVLDSGAPRYSHLPQLKRCRGSMDDLDKVGRDRSHTSMVDSWEHHRDRKLKGSTDLLARLQEEEDKLSKVLVASRKERNEELTEAKDRVSELRRPFRYPGDNDYDEPDTDTLLETSSNLLDYRSHLYSAPGNVDKVLTKVASDNVRGYAYKVAIPVANTQYDVPRRTAPAPDLSKVRDDAPPKPRRFASPEYLN